MKFHVILHCVELGFDTKNQYEHIKIVCIFEYITLFF